MKYAPAALLAAMLVSGCEKTAPPELPARATVDRPLLSLTHPVTQHEILLIPRQAIVERAGIPGVFVLSEEREARFRLVKRGRVRGERIEVVSGLAGTETLVLGDLKDVYDGTPIKTN